MKKHLLLLSFALTTLTICGQTAIPNGGFETWATSIYNFPKNYPYTSSAEKGLEFLTNAVPSNVTKVSPGYHGSYALALSTVVVGTDTIAGYALNFDPNDDGPSSWHGGIPYSQKPTGFKGYYKYNIPAATTDLNGDGKINSSDSQDFGLIIIAFSKKGKNIGTYYFLLGDSTDTFTPFDKTFDPALTETPDSVIIGASSSYAVLSNGAGVVGATLVLDSIAFTDVTSQPDSMNGDFETWQEGTMEYLSGWNPNTDHSQGVSKTTEKKNGSYAAEIKTYLGETNNHVAAQSGQLSTGYWDESNSYQYPLGGYPFTNESDTLAFYYKYAPSGNDKAGVSLYFKTNNETIFAQDGWYSSLNLDASNEFKYIEMPFDIGFTPDSVVIMIQSSYWADTAVSYVGSDLIIDDVHFKSQPLTTTSIINTKGDNAIRIYPNPASNAFQVNGIEGTATLSLLDISGKTLFTKDVSARDVISTNALHSGVYIVAIKSNGLTKKIKLVVQKE